MMDKLLAKTIQKANEQILDENHVLLDDFYKKLSDLSYRVQSTKYIHYGNDHFDRDLFQPIKNDCIPWNKPMSHTGLWASPVNSDNSWREFVMYSYTDRIPSLEKSFIFSLKENSKVLRIHNNTDLMESFKNPFITWTACGSLHSALGGLKIDYEGLIKQGYDAIEVYIADEETYFGFYGWDCDSLLVLNPDCIIEEAR
jgi:hypothetical protein